MTNFLIGRAYRDYLSAMGFCVELVSTRAGLELPEILVGIEFVFLVGLIRKATQEPVTPLSAAARQPVKSPLTRSFSACPSRRAGRTGSFQRAFSAWTGASVSKSRQPGV